MASVLALLCSLVLALAPAAPAATITFWHAGVGSGSVGGQPFADKAFTIAATADPALRRSFGTVYDMKHLTATISIADVGDFTILTPTRTFVNFSNALVGFSRFDPPENDLFDGPVDPVFATWDMQSNLGPITGAGNLEQWDLNPQIQTTGGLLLFNTAPTAVTFTAYIPEPASGTIAIVVLAVGVITVVRGRENSNG